MNHEHQRIQKTLKSLMKQNQVTYEIMGRRLRLSPATVKRRLNGPDLTLRQIKDFAETLSLSFYELIELSKKMKREPQLLTSEQEELLASDLLHIHLLRLVLARQDFASIKDRLRLSERDLRQKIRACEKVGLIELHPKDRLVAKVRFPFRWQTDGPLSQKYGEWLLKNLFARMKRNGAAAGIFRKFELALSSESYQHFCQDLEAVYLKYRGLSELHLDSKVELKELVSGLLFVDQFSIWDEREKI